MEWDDVMSEQKRIFLSSPHMSGDEQKYIQDEFDLKWIAPVGNTVDSFKQQLRKYTDGTVHAVGSTGRAADQLRLRLLNITKGDKVFCSTVAVVVTADAIISEGATPVLIDSVEETWNVCPK